MDITNKVAVITGGAEGIGYTTADLFLQKGAKAVALLDVNETLGTKAANTLNSKYGADKATFWKCDVTADLERVSKEIFDKYKVVDILMNNAGILNDFALKKTVDINVTALMEWSFKFWEHMRKDKGGQGGIIINLASIYGFRVDQYLPIYQASKFAVFGFTKSLGHKYNYDRSGVRVVAICPGFTETKLVTNIKMSNESKFQKDFDDFLAKQLWQKVDSVANCALELVQKAESGTAWLIEGGKPIVQV